MADYFSTFSNPNVLGSLGADQQLQALQAFNTTKNQNAALLKAYDPDTAIGGQMLAAKYRPDTPGLKFTVSNPDPVLGFGEAVGNGINNYYAMKNYREQGQQVRDMSSAYQNAAQKYQDMAQRQYDNEMGRQRTVVETGNRYHQNPKDPRAWADYNTATGGDLSKLEANTRVPEQVKIDMTPDQTQAKLEQEQLIRTNQRNRFIAESGGITPEQVFANTNQGALTPQIQNVFNKIYGYIPKDAQDFADRANQGKITQTNAEAAPTLKAQEITKGDLGIDKAGYDNEVARVEADFAEREKKAKVQLDEAKAKEFAVGQHLFDQLKQSGELYTKDPNKQAEIQARLGMYGVKWDPPNAKYKTFGSGKNLLMMDMDTGMVGKPDAKGQVAEWHPVQPPQ